MSRNCVKCGHEVSETAIYCEKCGGTEFSSQTENEKPAGYFPSLPGRVISCIVASALVLIPIIYVTIQLVLNGIDFGKYGLDEMFVGFDFNTILSGRRSEYQMELMEYVKRGMLACFAIVIPCCLVLKVKGSLNVYFEAKNNLVSGMLCSVAFSTAFTLLGLFSFEGVYRIITVVLFYLTAIVYLCYLIYMSIELGGYAVFLSIATMAMGLFVSLLFSSLFALGLLIFGEHFYIVAFIGMVLCSAPAGVSTGQAVVVNVYVYN